MTCKAWYSFVKEGHGKAVVALVCLHCSPCSNCKLMPMRDPAVLMRINGRRLQHLIVSLPLIHVTSWAPISQICVTCLGPKKTRVEKMSQIRHCSQERCNSLEPCFLLQRQISAEPQRVSGHGRGQDCLSSGNLITRL